MNELRQRAWECAYVLMEDYRDRLQPRSYGLCRNALRAGPDRIAPRRARRLQAIYAALVEPRQ